MQEIRFLPLPTDQVRALQAGADDANGQTPERSISDGAGVPCRHCLTEIAAGEPYLILAHRPFATVQPYAELGPIFLCERDCAAWSGEGAPEMFAAWPQLLMRGYTADERIAPGSGRIVKGDALLSEARALFDSDPRIASIHLRSASNNCFMARIERRDAM